LFRRRIPRRRHAHRSFRRICLTATWWQRYGNVNGYFEYDDDLRVFRNTIWIIRATRRSFRAHSFSIRFGVSKYAVFAHTYYYSFCFVSFCSVLFLFFFFWTTKSIRNCREWLVLVCVRRRNLLDRKSTATLGVRRFFLVILVVQNVTAFFTSYWSTYPDGVFFYSSLFSRARIVPFKYRSTRIASVSDVFTMRLCAKSIILALKRYHRVWIRRKTIPH